MSQNKIPISINDQKLFGILHEIIDPINQQQQEDDYSYLWAF